jgi:hypothetical protein
MENSKNIWTRIGIGSNQSNMHNQKDIEGIKSVFLYAAIADAQGTIRATDSKIAVLMVILAIPLTKLGNIYRDCFALYNNENRCVSNLSIILIFIFCCLWLISFWTAIRALHPVDNPADHIDGERPTGIFYSGGLFQPNFWAANFKCFSKAHRQIQHQLGQLPSSAEDLIKELTFEHMKLIYIRTIKLKRLGYTFDYGKAWIFIGGITCGYY